MPLSNTTIVTAHYNECLSWLTCKKDLYQALVVCDKETAAPIDHALFDKVYTIPNMGFEVSAFLYYIIANYDNLPEYTAFIHGHETSWHQLHPRGLIAAIDEANMQKYNFVSLNIKPHPQVDNYMIDSVHPIHGLYESIRDLWSTFFEEFLGPRPTELHHDSCAQFVVSRQAILRNPLHAYKKWYELAIDPSQNNKLVATMFELIWHVIFGEDHVCMERDAEYLRARFVVGH